MMLFATTFCRFCYNCKARSSHPEVFLKTSQNSQENTCVRVSFLIKLQACNFFKKETLAQVFYCELCEIFKSTFCYRTPLVAASANRKVFFSFVLLWNFSSNLTMDSISFELIFYIHVESKKWLFPFLAMDCPAVELFLTWKICFEQYAKKND